MTRVTAQAPYMVIGLTMYGACAVTRVILDTLIVHVTY